VGALDWDFFTRLPVGPLDEGGGMANGLVGSAAIVGLATVFAVPVGILAAIALAEYRRNALATSVRFIAELLGGVPSIIIGIFAAALFGYLSTVYEHLRGERLNFYGWSGVFALGVMMVPIVMRASEEALKLVPTALRNASFALGGSHAQTVLRVTIPAALPAIITGVFLAIARIAGETAPLLLTAGFNSYWPDSLNDFTPTLPVYIFKYAGSAFPNQQRQAWAAAFVLMAVVLLLNFGIRFVTGKRVVSASRAD
jgi:phosphate transport system permease protein